MSASTATDVNKIIDDAVRMSSTIPSTLSPSISPVSYTPAARLSYSATQSVTSTTVRTSAGQSSNTSSEMTHHRTTPRMSLTESKLTESQTDSGLGLGSTIQHPPANATDFHPFFNDMSVNPLSESSKLLSTHNHQLENEVNEPRPVTPLLALSAGHDTNKGDRRSRDQAGQYIGKFCSLLYAIVLIVLGTVFPLSEILALHVKPMFYQAYNVYLFGMSLLFLIYAYLFLLETKSRNHKHLLTFTRTRGSKGYRMETVETLDDVDSQKKEDSRRPSVMAAAQRRTTGSFYLRMGAVLFGLGSMIYFCLQFGQYLELPFSIQCGDMLSAVVPALCFAFVFIQLYFIFLNSKVRVHRFPILVRFGLMHLLATNVCIWLSALIGETMHTMELSLTNGNEYDTTPTNGEVFFPLSFGPNTTRPTNATAIVPSQKPLHLYMNAASEAQEQSLMDFSSKSCRAQTIIGNILQKAQPFLFPCVVQYCLICATVLYIMWASVRRSGATSRANYTEDAVMEPASLSEASLMTTTSKRSRYTVDCNGATRGLFLGLLLLLVTIISTILFFVWIWRKDLVVWGVLQSLLVEVVLYTATLIAVCAAFFQLRPLRFDVTEGFFINDILLVIGQLGVYMYCAFVLVACHQAIVVDPHRMELFGLLSAVLQSVQATVQTLFLLDALRRRPARNEHLRDKPGRELVTFLLVCNVGLWAVDSLTAWKEQLYPAQNRFYGLWAWTVIGNIFIPLKIFYRFHSSVCLSIIWKKAWKLKSCPSTPVAITAP